MISESMKTNVCVEECQRISINVAKPPEETPDVVLELGQQLISLTRTPCFFGGERQWFICPGCSRRVGLLYRKPLSPHYFCRHCNNLTYQLRKYHRSQLESMIKAQKRVNATRF